MTLINKRDFPPHGYLYKEAALSSSGRPWEMPPDIAQQGLDIAAKTLQQARINNPQAGLDPSYEACVRAIGEYTCARLTPKQRKEYCGGEPKTEQERVAWEVAQRQAVRPRGCVSCGGGRK